MGAPTPRPNPFAIPSGTLVRFVLLIVAASTTAVSDLSQSMAMLLGVRRADVIAYQVCVQEKISDAVSARRAAPDTPAAGNVFDPILDCHDPRSEVGLWPSLLAIAAFWLAVLAVYFVLPRWRIRRRRMRPLDAGRLPELAAYLSDLRREAGVRQHVTFLLAPLNPKVTGLAFGRVGRRYVMLSGGLVALFSRDRQAFRTVVLHELAHIRNRDLDITFVTIIVWRFVLFLILRSFVGIALQVALGTLPMYGIFTDLGTILQLLILLVLVPLARSAVLRSRELYADSRTTLWDSSPAGLQRLFDTYSTHEPRRFGRALRTHPPLDERRVALADGRNLFAMDFWAMTGVGITTTLGFSLITDFLGHPDNLPSDQIAVLFAAPLLAAGAGLSVWRAVLRSTVTGTPLRTGAAGIGLGLGLAVGGLMSPTMAFNLYGTRVSPLGILAPWVLLLCASGWALVGWIALVARSWMPVLAGRRRPLPLLIATLAAITVPVAVWLRFAMLLPGITLYVQAVEYPNLPPLATFAFAAAVLVLGQPVTMMLPLVLSLVLVPLAGRAWARRYRGQADPAWIALDPLPPDWQSAPVGVRPGSGSRRASR